MQLSRHGLATLVSLVTAASGLSGCSGDPGTNNGNGDGPGVMQQPGQVCVQTPPLPIAPGMEATKCLTAHLPTTQALNVVQIDAQQSFTHHVIFYREDNEVPDAPLADCQPLEIFTVGRGIVREPVFIGETERATLALPKGVAFTFQPGAPYRLEVHYLNAGSQPVSSQAQVCLTPAPDGSTTTAADMIFDVAQSQLDKVYDNSGTKGLPPGVQTTVNPPGFARPQFAGSKIFGLTTHEHRIGTGVTVSKSTGAGDPGQMLLTNTDWQHPTLLRFPDDQLLTFGAGEGLRWTCTYNNTNNFYVTFGQSAFTNEMCIVWAYYFPGRGFSVHWE